MCMYTKLFASGWTHKTPLNDRSGPNDVDQSHREKDENDVGSQDINDARHTCPSNAHDRQIINNHQRHRYPAKREFPSPPIITIHVNAKTTQPNSLPTSNTTQALPLPTPHALKLPHKRFLHFLIARPCLAHLLHSQRSNDRKTERAEGRLLLADGRVGCDADVFEQAEVGGVAVRLVSQYMQSSKVDGNDGARTYHWLYISTCIRNQRFVHTRPLRKPSSLSQRARRKEICFARPFSSPS
jgi:hypothetical protein